MSVRSQDTAPTASAQLPGITDDAWEQEIVPQLPAELSSQARTLKAFVRTRCLPSALHLLRAVLVMALSDYSMRALGTWGVLTDVADMSEAAWRKRMVRSSVWLGWLLSALLMVSPVQAPPTKRRVRLIDATRLGEVGGRGDAWRVHWDYDFTAGQLGSVVVTDRSQGEHLGHFVLAEDDIIVADSGYGYRRSLKLLHAAKADGVLRFHPATCPLEDAEGTPWDAIAWLRAPGSATRTWEGWVRVNGERLAVRVVATPMPPEAAKRAQQQKERRAKSRKRTPAASTKLLAGWLLLVTTLDAQAWPAEAVTRLYRARWQVELVFKRLKQLLRVRPVRCKRRDMAEATVRALLIAWVLQERLAASLREALEGDGQWPVSSWRVCQLSLEVMRQEVLGSWTRERVRACLPRLTRFLCNSPRERIQQETQIRTWLASFPGMDFSHEAS
jgi:hypothetical protein